MKNSLVSLTLFSLRCRCSWKSGVISAPRVNRCVCVDLIPLQDLTKQLDEVTQNSEIVEIRQKEAECELEAARDRVQQQATEILLKASKTLNFSSLMVICLYNDCEHLHPLYPRDTS